MAQTNVAGNIAQEQLKLQDVYNKMQKLGLGNLLSNLAFAQPEVRAAMIASLPADVQTAMRVNGIDVNDLMTFFGRQQPIQQTYQLPTFQNIVRNWGGIQQQQ